MKVVVEGCCHGELDKIYDVIGQVQEREGLAVDLLICCGDFQAVRNKVDLNCMAVPPKYREMGTFYKYYTGERVAPVLTIFIGGNHEASNHLWELSYGGWVAPNIYYLGVAGVVQYGGVRIAGLSGIFKEGDYRKGRHECPPFSEGTKRSIYHVRSCDVFRLKQLSGRVDIALSHDWPQGIYHHGNKTQLLRKKSYFAEEIAQNSLGSPAAMELLAHLRPAYWFSAHLHVKFAAVFHHHDYGSLTKFLALDKCLPGRRFLQVLDIPSPSPPPYRLSYDPEWLAIVRSTESIMSYSHSLWLPPQPSTDPRVSFTPTEEELAEVEKLFRGNLTVPDNFTVTVTPHSSTPSHSHSAQPVENCQTAQFCRTLQIANPFTPNFRSHNVSLHSSSVPLDCSNPDEIALGEEEEEEEDQQDVSLLGLTNEIPPVPDSTSTPAADKRRYPWLNDMLGDELVGEDQNVSKTQHSSGGVFRKTFAADSTSDISFTGVQKSLNLELSGEERCLKVQKPLELGSGLGSRASRDGLSVVMSVGGNPDEINILSDTEECPEASGNPDEVTLEEEGVTMETVLKDRRGLITKSAAAQSGEVTRGQSAGQSETETGGRSLTKRPHLRLPQPTDTSPREETATGASVTSETIVGVASGEAIVEAVRSKVEKGAGSQRKPVVIKRRNFELYQLQEEPDQ